MRIAEEDKNGHNTHRKEGAKKMTTKELFYHIMESHTEMAIATSTYSQPNVRVVNFYYDSTDCKIYFITVDVNNKIREFDINPKIAFTTIPVKDREHVRAKGIVRRSRRNFFEIEEYFRKKIPGVENLLKVAGEQITLFEIEFQTAVVTTNYEVSDVLEMDSLQCL